MGAPLLHHVDTISGDESQLWYYDILHTMALHISGSGSNALL